MRGTERVLFLRMDNHKWIPFRQGAREGLFEKLEAVLTGGKGSASGSRFTEQWDAGNLEMEFRQGKK